MSINLISTISIKHPRSANFGDNMFIRSPKPSKQEYGPGVACWHGSEADCKTHQTAERGTTRGHLFFFPPLPVRLFENSKQHSYVNRTVRIHAPVRGPGGIWNQAYILPTDEPTNQQPQCSLSLSLTRQTTQQSNTEQNSRAYDGRRCLFHRRTLVPYSAPLPMRRQR